MSQLDEGADMGFSADMFRDVTRVDSETLGAVRLFGNVKELRFPNATAGIGFAKALRDYAEFQHIQLIKIPNMGALHEEDVIALAMFELAAPGMNVVETSNTVRRQIDTMKEEMGSMPLEDMKNRVDEFNTNRSQLWRRSGAELGVIQNEFIVPENESLTFGEVLVLSKCMATTMSFPKLQHINEKGLAYLLRAPNLNLLDIPSLQNPTSQILEMLAKFEIERSGKVVASPMMEALVEVRKKFLEMRMGGHGSLSRGPLGDEDDEEPGF